MVRTEPVRASTVPKAQESATFQIRRIAPGDKAGIDVTTQLHMDLLGFGPMAQFGPGVIRETIYDTAINEQLLEVAVAEVNGRPAGFIAYTIDPHRFHSTLIGSHRLKVIGSMAKALLSRPARLRHIPRALKVVVSRDDLGEDATPVGTEVVCFGVYPEYLTADFMQKTKIRVGVKLLQHAASYFRQHGFDTTRMIVDADNTRALLFYQSLGGEMTPCTFGGVPSYIVLMKLDDLF
jgi:ribosomal protein S18 acetylase RimI-like enzyme